MHFSTFPSPLRLACLGWQAAHAHLRRTSVTTALTSLAGAGLLSSLAWGAPPVPSYVAPVTQAPVQEYIDDTRGVYVPEHTQLRSRTVAELARAAQPTPGAVQGMAQPGSPDYTRQLNTLANGVADTRQEITRIAQEPGLLANNSSMDNMQLAQLSPAAGPTAANAARQPMAAQAAAPRPSLATPARTQEANLSQFPSLATGGAPRVPASVGGQGLSQAPLLPMAQEPAASVGSPVGSGLEIAVGQAAPLVALDLQNGIVRLREERITVRRGLQRMLDQIGGGAWTVVYDLEETNAALPDMEISIYAEEPFINVLNALLARLQSRSGQPLRVIKYDQTQRLVITDRTTAAGATGAGAPSGPDAVGTIVVSEAVLRESKVSLHYDEIPLVDALENIVNQAGKGQWRLRMYAGMDQVLKPAHVEEPFAIALERILKVFNLRYEIFPGGKLIVVTAGDRFGFRGVE